jgi:RNA polymerase sigma-70 factor (ECF subfamily)
MIAAVNPRPAPERDWLDQCRAGDADAWRRLYDEQFPFVYRLAVRLGAGEREAADVAQEVFVRVFRGLGAFRGEAQLRTWLYRITCNEVARAGREAGLRRAFAGLLRLVGAGDAPAAPPPDRAVERAQSFAELQEILAHMKPAKRTVFVLFEIEELSLEEIAGVVEAPLETVRSRLRHARADFDRLRRQRAQIAGGRR